MAECGICGNDKRALWCGGCTSHLTLRARINVIKVTSQLSSLQNSVTQALEGRSNQASDLNGNANIAGNEARTIQLHAQIDLLQKKLDRIQSAVVKTHNRTMELRQQLNTVDENIMQSKESMRIIEEKRKSQFESCNASLISRQKLFEKAYRDMLHLSLGLQKKCCQDLLDIFVLKKKRKKNGYEIVLGLNVIPDLTQLGHYSVTTINSGLERLCTFTVFLASYMGLRLPYNLKLPQKLQPKVLIGPYNEALWISHSPKTMLRSSSREFHNYCRLLAMQALNVAHIALKLGISSISDLQDIAKLNQLVAQVYLRVESLIKSGFQPKIYSGTLSVDLDALQDHLITAIDVGLNGQYAEWNIVEAP